MHSWPDTPVQPKQQSATAGTVYADPYPGFVHGVTPAICKHGCEPTHSKDIGETDEQRLWREAHEFIDQFACEMQLSDEVRSAPLPCAQLYKEDGCVRSRVRV